jgi:hypothetical protein
VGAAALGPVLGLGRRADRRVRGALAEPAQRAFLSAFDVALGGFDAALRSEVAQVAFDRVLASAFADDFLDRVIERVADSPDVERLVRGLVDSRLVDAVLMQLLESEGLWVLVEEVVQSPTVTSAISQQGVGFANQMAEVMRDRSRTADDRLERLARRFTRRAPREQPADALGSAHAADAVGSGGPAADAVGSGGPAADALGSGGTEAEVLGSGGPEGEVLGSGGPDGLAGVVPDPTRNGQTGAIPEQAGNRRSSERPVVEAAVDDRAL